MAFDPLSMTASLIAVAGFAWTSTKALYDVIDALVNAPQAITNIKNDLEALQAVLKSLLQVLDDKQSAVLDPVLRQIGIGVALKGCKAVCDDFTATIVKYTTHSTENRFSKRDRLTVTFRKSKIAAFTERLDLCKRTINLALTSATLATCTHILDNTELSLGKQEAALKAHDKQLAAAESNIQDLVLIDIDEESEIIPITAKERDLALNLILELRKVVEADIWRTKLSLDDEARLCLQSLFLTNPEDDLAAIRRLKGERVEGTCEWLFAQEEYTAWLGGDNPQLLRLVGAPGIGKTMISSFLVEELKKRVQTAPTMTFVYYFCDNKDEKRNTAFAIIRGILFQILKQQPMLYKHIQQDYERMKDRLFGDIDALWRILHDMLKDSNAGEVYILIDAFDECEKSSRKALLKYLQKLFITLRDLNVKFLITYRPESDIQSYLEDINGHLQIDSGKISADLSKFIQIKVDNLSKKRKFPQQLKQDVKDALEKKAEGTFLWASLVIDDISETRLTSKVRGKLQALPSSLGEVYGRILGSINKEDETDAKFILQWVVEARRPLTVSELAMACALGPQKWNKNTIPPADTLDELKDSFKCCESLLYLDTSNNTINLIHQSAKDYLLGGYLQANNLSQYHVVPDKANLLIFQVCWKYLGMEEFEQGTLVVGRSSDNKLSSKPLSNEFLDAHCFLRYAVREWQEHAFAAGLALVTDSGWISNSLGIMKTLRDAWLHRAVRKGHEAIVELLLDHKADIDAREGGSRDSQTALHLAVKGGHDAIVKLLLDHKADVDATTYPGSQTALHLASEGGHESIAKLLVTHKADVDAKNVYGWTALHLAVGRGHQGVVQLLVEEGADITAKDEDGQMALHWAAERGHGPIAKLLLGHKVDVDATTYPGSQTALHLASEGGHESIAKLMVYHKADVDAKNDDGWSALHLAVTRGHQGVVQLLVEEGADITAKDEDGQMALHLAAERGHETTAKLLLQHNADVDAKGGLNRTALHVAVEKGHQAIVKLLLDHKADVNINQDYKVVALHLAVEGGHEAIVRLLLEYKADVDAKNNNGWTALHLAVERGHQAIVKLLLNHKADVHMKKGYNVVPLHLAAEGGHEAIVRLLLDYKADIDAKDNNGWTALHLASFMGYEAVVRLLLEKGADFSVKNKGGQTALDLAADDEPKAVERLLLEKGADFSIKCKGGQTALDLTADDEPKAVERLLLEKGADFSAKNEAAQTALDSTADDGHEAVV